MMRIPTRWVAVPFVAMMIGTLAAAPPAPRRAKRPEFPPSTVETFFPDARAKLVGERPGPRAAVAESSQPVVSDQTPSAGGVWSKLISSETLEDEIKARVPKLAAAVENPIRFKSGDYQSARRELALLAAMLAIVSEYDGRVRWKAEAARLPEELGRASNNCKVASDAALADARARAEDMQLLVRGGSQSPEATPMEVNWPQFADRTLLMQRLEEAQQLITPGISSEKTFASNSPELRHEAEIVAALAEIITRSGYEFADDETYLEYARAMQQQAGGLGAATLEGMYDRARSEANEIGQSCTKCHEGYRG